MFQNKPSSLGSKAVVVKVFLSISVIVGVTLLTACESNIQFSEADEKEKCLVKQVRGERVCVAKRTQIFKVKGIHNKPINILFVLDVSDSMRDDLVRMGKAFLPLMSQIQDTNWHILFTTADHGDHEFIRDPQGKALFSQQNWQDYKEDKPYFGQFMTLEHKGQLLPIKSLHKKVPFYNEIFKDSLTRSLEDDCHLPPFCQGPLEQPLRALNASFERLSTKDSSLWHSRGDVITFLITDEDERVEDKNQATSAYSVLLNFESLFPTRNLYAFTLSIQDDDCLKQQQQHSPQSIIAKKVAQLATLTGGKNISLCEKDYTQAFEKVSYFLRTLIEKITLKEKPLLPKDTKVTFLKGQNIAWKAKGKNILFDQALEPNSKIKVEYWVLDKKPIQKEQKVAKKQ